MKTGSIKTGFTLIEMVVVIAIIAILISMVVTITKRINDQSKERLTRETITLLGNALEQFRGFGYEYKNGYASFGFVFPLDCSGMPTINIVPTLNNALGTAVTINKNDPSHDPCNSGSEVLYFVLSQISDCRATLDKIDKSLLTNDSNDKPPVPLTITVPTGATTATLPFTRIIDPWKTPLRYDYYQKKSGLPVPGTNKTFPVITSAGPDKLFDTADDISNVK